MRIKITSHDLRRRCRLADGASDLANLRLCCATCNRRKGQMGADAYAASEVLDRRRRQIRIEEREAPGDSRPKQSRREH